MKFYDYRPAEIELSQFTSQKADLLALPFEEEGLHSVSCMHVVEHIGLGRYGDSLNPDGDLLAMAELRRVLAPEGTLLLVVPVGKSRITFNAHRIYSHAQIIEYFSDLTLQEFALIPDESGKMIANATSQQADAQTYGCGCFWFRK